MVSSTAARVRIVDKIGPMQGVQPNAKAVPIKNEIPIPLRFMPISILSCRFKN